MLKAGTLPVIVVLAVSLQFSLQLRIRVWRRSSRSPLSDDHGRVQSCVPTLHPSGPAKLLVVV